MQDVYNGLEPHVRRGEVKRIAVVQELEKGTHSPIMNYAPEGGDKLRIIACFGWQFPLVSCGATYASKKVWGYADVREDGSAAFSVPAEVPVYFMALDAEGRAVQRMRTFTHFMPGEVQGCVGCHADRNHATPASTNRLAISGDVQPLVEPEWGVKGFSYSEIVQPVLDRHCTSCHNEREQPGGVDLSGDKTDFFNVSYDGLARTGTLGARNWQQHNTISGPAGDKQRGESPWVSWIWTINGAGHNIHRPTRAPAAAASASVPLLPSLFRHQRLGVLTRGRRPSILKPWSGCASPTIRKPPSSTEVSRCNSNPAGESMSPLVY